MASMKREEEVVHSTRQRSESPLEVVGRSVGASTRPGPVGSRSRRTDQEEAVRSSLRQPSLGTRTTSKTGSSHNAGNSDLVKKPLDVSSGRLGREHLHRETYHGKNNGFI